MDKMNDAERSEHLEELVDAHGINRIISDLEGICYEKAEHIRSNWNDETQAKAWDKVARGLDRAQVSQLDFDVERDKETQSALDFVEEAKNWWFPR